ncbi:MAG: hypothetical protein LBT45_03975 [Rickettsiales bacterium]|jgi:O-antigen/teichoic acid export membrane protein|nr:hypothetical protein [Rickettsiales bacterium]
MKNKKKISSSAIIGTVATGLFALAWFAMFLWPFGFADRRFAEEWLTWSLRILNICVFLWLIWAVAQRIREITKGDDDDTGEY